MDEQTWLQEMSDYADINLNVKPRQLSRMLEAATLVKPWTRDHDPIDWAAEWFRNRHPEDN